MLFVKQLHLQSEDSWGSHDCSEYKNKYDLPSHDLRRYEITALINEGVFPYSICDVLRHKILGMSELKMMHKDQHRKTLLKQLKLLQIKFIYTHQN